MNELYRLLNEMIEETHILSFLQDYGVISDNCYKVHHVINDYEAYDFIRSRRREFDAWVKGKVRTW